MKRIAEGMPRMTIVVMNTKAEIMRAFPSLQR
jgi:hypothetical protein